jgi:hypothetical protein
LIWLVVFICFSEFVNSVSSFFFEISPTTKNLNTRLSGLFVDNTPVLLHATFEVDKGGSVNLLLEIRMDNEDLAETILNVM